VNAIVWQVMPQSRAAFSGWGIFSSGWLEREVDENRAQEDPKGDDR
jgi:hypothetical protein